MSMTISHLGPKSVYNGSCWGVRSPSAQVWCCDTVVRQVLWARVLDGDLPSQRSALHINYQAHVMSKAHIAEVLLQEDCHDLHVDGMSTGGQKYVAQAVTTKGTHSLGFTSVATEDTTTLVEVTLQLPEEQSGLHTEHEAQQNFLDMLSCLS